MTQQRCHQLQQSYRVKKAVFVSYKAKQIGSFCSITRLIKEKPVIDHVGEHPEDPVRHPKIWNYRTKRLKTASLSSCRTLLQLVTALLGHGLRAWLDNNPPEGAG
jgi:hypothetical protein